MPPEIVAWGLDATRPARSRLVSLEPIGVGTPMVESLPSYLLRLAPIHGLDPGRLADLVLSPIVTGPAAAYESRFARTGGALAGVGAAAETWAGEIAALTGVPAVLATTLVPLRALLAPTHLRREAGVCPACLEDAQLGAFDVHEPLAWSVLAATVCPRHRVRLVTTCPACAKPLRALTRRARVGHCRLCDARLGTSTGHEAAEDPYELWTADRVGAMLAARPASGEVLEGMPIAVVSAAADVAGGGNALARRLGVGRGLVSTWRSGTVRPSLPALLAMCAIAGVDPAGVVAGRLDPTSAPTPPPIGRARRAVDWRCVERAIRAELERPDPRSLRRVLADLGIDRSWAVRRYPELCERLRMRRVERVTARTAARRASIATAVAARIDDLRADGLEPSRRALEPLLPAGLSVREEAVRSAWRASR